ncbi:SigE-dependent sporulation protein [Virgibacillus phasianinus]|uniref:SigE-dependent sporulation protein n=1 Tax=Virgibacillus phasianinus TaxID=2017483 RepID=A0A220TY12_9BACI|nr:sporulation YhaL family protein [Virgibacillus phasianinus]ASK60874.1 SigE-dependent sporulation protein [Virgibacillus phasianinus]
MIIGVPWWVFMLILCIFLSGYMAYRAMRAERRLEQQFIEREGKVYIDRMEKERETKERMTQ